MIKIVIDNISKNNHVQEKLKDFLIFYLLYKHDKI